VDWALIILRVLHVVSALFWLGAAMTVTFFVEPTVEALGPRAQPFMDHIMNRRKLAVVLAGVAMAVSRYL
jgi:uncharacterized membrane protein